MVKVLDEHLGADSHSVHLIMEAFQKAAQKLLGVLLTETTGKFALLAENIDSASTGLERGGNLLAAHEFGSVNLNLAPEIRGTDGLVVDRSPQGLCQLCKL